MGIKGLTDVMRSAASNLSDAKKAEFASIIELSNVANSKLVIDFSMLAFRYGTTIKKGGDLQEMSCGCVIGFLRLIHRCQALKIKPIIVFDQIAADVDAYAEVYKAIGALRARGEISKGMVIDAPMVLQSKTDTKMERIDKRKAAEEATKKESFAVTRYLVDSIAEICRYLGADVHFPAVEADWLVAYLGKKYGEEGPTYILSDDTDGFIYDIGKAKLLRSFSILGKTRLKGFNYEKTTPSVVWEALGMLSADRRTYLGAILGCDYFSGVIRLGPARINHIFNLDPNIMAAKSIRLNGIQQLVPMAKHLINSSGVVDSNTMPMHPTFVDGCKKRLISPRCFDGLTVVQLDAITAPYVIPLTAVDDFLRNFYTSSLSDIDYHAFRNAVSVLQTGPAIEGEFLERNSALVTGGGVDDTDSEASSSSSSSSKPVTEFGMPPIISSEDMARFADDLHERFGEVYFEMRSSLVDVGINIHNVIKEESEQKMDEMFEGYDPDAPE